MKESKREENLNFSIEKLEEITYSDIADMARRFDFELTKSNSFSEKIIIRPDGYLECDTKKENHTFFAILLDSIPKEGVYILAKKIKDEFPGFNFSFEIDPQDQWIKYTVSSARK